jgi:hypothetical protein
VSDAKVGLVLFACIGLPLLGYLVYCLVTGSHGKPPGPGKDTPT